MMTYRTRTYIAGDWDTDKDAVEKLHQWNESHYWGLSFTDAHELTQARDSSLNCSIKASLKTRMDVSRRFVLIVGNHTNTITSGACYLCYRYSNSRCEKGYNVDNRSYIKYECDKAKEAGIKIIVLYKDSRVRRDRCPLPVQYEGIHAPMCYRGEDGRLYWDYQSVKKAFDDSNDS